MDEILYKYLLSLDLTVDDIKGLCDLAPGLEIISHERAFANIEAVVAAGYPEEDIDSLICVNPGFLCNETEYLAQKLSEIDGDVEEALKDDPFII